MAANTGECIRGTLDRPQAGQALMGFTRFEGWVVSNSDDPLKLEVRIGNRAVPDSPQRFRRPDVDQAFPELAPDNPRPGFFVPVHTRDYPDGQYTVTLLARTTDDWQVI